MKCPNCKHEIETRSSQQNRALHKYFTIISETLNEMGMEFHYQGLKGSEITMPYSPQIVKDFFWRPIQTALFNKSSTTKLTTDEMNKIIDIISKFFAERGVVIEFPSNDTIDAQV